ncbi:MAG: Signal peptide protein [Pedosphaera sp.]|nr:Signal peptide protein [Pedosphaera sp.]
MSVMATLTSAKDQVPTLPKGYKLVYQQDFSKAKALQDFVMADPKAWKLSQINNHSSLELVKQSDYKPAVRSPVNIAVLADKVVGDFILEVELLSTTREYGHRDMCLVFGMKSPTEFYYTHLASNADPHAHNIFIVNNKERENIARETTGGIKWETTNAWHKVRVERKISDGSIKVYFDDLTKPIMVAEDKTFTSGYLGFGSFDDTGKIGNIKVWAPKMEKQKTGFYQRSEH